MANRGAVADLALLTCVALGASLLAVLVIRPLAGPQVGFDTAASVIHFQRILAGDRLEAFVTTTPKPLITVIDGALHAVGGWAAVAWGAIAAHGIATGTAALLARHAGGLAAAVFVAVAFAGNAFLLLEASYAYAVPWAVALWSVAGLAATATRPRWTTAGVALLLATLARIETLVLVAGVGVAAVAWWLVTSRRQRRSAIPRPPAAAWGVLLLPVAALPVMALHDWLLTGDPMFWATVSERYTTAASARGAIAGPLEVASSVATLAVGAGLAVPLALAGVIGLAARRCWAILVGVLALGPGMGAFLVLLAARGTYVSGRYSAPTELAILFAAGVGFALLLELAGRRLRERATLVRSALRALSPVATGLVALLLTMPWGPLDRGLVRRIADERRLQANAVVAAPVIARALDRLPGSRDPAPSHASVTVPSGRPPVLHVPGLLRPRLAMDLGIPVDRVAGLGVVRGVAQLESIGPGQIVYHDRNGSGADELPLLETGSSFEHAGVVFEPLLADPERQMWIHAVRSR